MRYLQMNNYQAQVKVDWEINRSSKRKEHFSDFAQKRLSQFPKCLWKMQRYKLKMRQLSLTNI